MNPIESTFRSWTQRKLNRHFQLHTVSKCPSLEQWILGAETIAITEFEQQFLNYIQKNASGNVSLWSEKEIELRIVGPILSLVNFDIVSPQTGAVIAKSFAGEEFGGQVANHKISGRPDGLLAKGEVEPEMPYFCFHEYKKQESKSADPLGQLLAAMLIAHEKNEHQRPIYGAYVSGKNWYFVILEGVSYCISEVYSTSKDDDIYDIFRILRQLKNIVIGFLKEDKVI